MLCTCSQFFSSVRHLLLPSKLINEKYLIKQAELLLLTVNYIEKPYCAHDFQVLWLAKMLKQEV